MESDTAILKLVGVREYAEGLPVEIDFSNSEPDTRRLVVRARNEAGHNHTEVDLLDLLGWLHLNRPDLMAAAPDLAEAADKLLALDLEHDGATEEWTELREAVKALRVALAKERPNVFSGAVATPSHPLP